MAMTATKIKESRAVSVLLPLSVLTSHHRQVLVLMLLGAWCSSLKDVQTPQRNKDTTVACTVRTIHEVHGSQPAAPCSAVHFRPSVIWRETHAQHRCMHACHRHMGPSLPRGTMTRCFRCCVRFFLTLIHTYVGRSCTRCGVLRSSRPSTCWRRCTC